jgi:hypothetical protein
MRNRDRGPEEGAGESNGGRTRLKNRAERKRELDKMRSCGILLHITSLPSPYGIGTLGKAAYDFVDS